MSETEARHADDVSRSATEVPEGVAAGRFGGRVRGKHAAPIPAVGPDDGSDQSSYVEPDLTTDVTADDGAGYDGGGAERRWRATPEPEVGADVDEPWELADAEPVDNEPVDTETDAELDAEPVAADSDAEPDVEPDAERGPNWWHRSHPTFAALMGFFAGVAYVIVVPGVYAAVLNWMLPEKTAQRLFPLVLIALIVPLVMLFPRKTRKFAQFMFIGIIATIVVVAVTAGVVLWFLVRNDA